LRSWRCDRPAANACSTKGGVRLRAIASVPALLVRTTSGHVVSANLVAAFGEDQLSDA
jgi:hypothetical protein